jgi:hypothetical protein
MFESLWKLNERLDLSLSGAELFTFESFPVFGVISKETVRHKFSMYDCGGEVKLGRKKKNRINPDQVESVYWPMT